MEERQGEQLDECRECKAAVKRAHMSSHEAWHKSLTSATYVMKKDIEKLQRGGSGGPRYVP